MSSSWFVALLSLLTGAAAVLGWEGLARARVDRGLRLVGSPSADTSVPGLRLRSLISRGALRESPEGTARVRRSAVLGGLLTVPAGFVGLKLAGPVGVLLGAAIAVALPRELARRNIKVRQAKLEQQLADAVETCALAVRAGLSIAQSIEFAADESEPPIRPLLRRTLEEQRVGAPFEQALQRFGETVGTEDSRLFVLVVTTHARSGGNLAGALDEVTATIRHRIEVRRELRALSAQGRVSGAILGSLPIAFFLVLAGTSHRELAPVYRSPAGIAMVSAGLVMEAVAYLWIRRLIRVEA